MGEKVYNNSKVKTILILHNISLFKKIFAGDRNHKKGLWRHSISKTKETNFLMKLLITLT
jgi:hypothetical protein